MILPLVNFTTTFVEFYAKMIGRYKPNKNIGTKVGSKNTQKNQRTDVMEKEALKARHLVSTNLEDHDDIVERDMNYSKKKHQKRAQSPSPQIKMHMIVWMKKRPMNP
jgi:hypothetical protein